MGTPIFTLFQVIPPTFKVLSLPLILYTLTDLSSSFARSSKTPSLTVINGAHLGEHSLYLVVILDPPKVFIKRGFRTSLLEGSSYRNGTPPVK